MDGHIGGRDSSRSSTGHGSHARKSSFAAASVQARRLFATARITICRAVTASTRAARRDEMRSAEQRPRDREREGKGKRGYVRVDTGGGLIINKKTTTSHT